MSDIVSAMNATVLPSIALVLFLLVFALVIWRVFRPASAARLRRERVLPLEDGVVVGVRTEACDGQA